MKRLAIVTALSAVLAAPLAARAELIQATLTGYEEVPVVSTAAAGQFRAMISHDDQFIDYELTYSGLMGAVTQAHIHCAPIGVNGPIVAFLAGFHDLGWDVDGKWIDNATLTDDNIILGVTPSETCPHTIATLVDLREAITAGDAYVNAHSVLHPAGEVRGQLESDEH